jgi:hypothetical protein
MTTVLSNHITLATLTHEDGNFIMNTTTQLIQTRMGVAQITGHQNQSAESPVLMLMKKCPSRPRAIRVVVKYLNLIAGVGDSDNEPPRTTQDLSICTLPDYAPRRNGSTGF